MGYDNQSRLTENYHKLGDLSKEQFLAVRSLDSTLIHLRNIESDNVLRILADGRRERIALKDVQVGDTIRLSGTIKKMMGQTEKTGWMTIENVQDFHYDKETGFLLFDNGKTCLTNADCREDVAALNFLINAPEYWVSKAVLLEMIDKTTTLKDFELAQAARTMTLDQAFDNVSKDAFAELDDFDDLVVEEHAEPVNEKPLPELMF